MIPFVDLKAQYQSIKAEIDSAVLRVLESGHYVLGEEVLAFEAEFAAACGVEYAVGVSSGTSALHLALLAAGVGPGDEVITVPFTFVATVAAIEYAGARPVLVDVEPNSLTMDVEALERAITPRTKVILPVHLYGHAADMDPILDLARDAGLLVVEDAAQAHLAAYRGRYVGGIGDLGCFSFYPGKNLGAYGEGGIVTTNDPKLARTLRMLRDWGAEKKYAHELKGFNYRLESLQAAILRVKLARLDAWTEARRAHAARYDAALADMEFNTPTVQAYARHVYHVYALRAADRDKLQAGLLEQGIQTGIHYPTPVHLLPAYANLGYSTGSFPQAERAAREVLSLPMYPELSEMQVQQVIDALRQVVGRGRSSCVA